MKDLQQLKLFYYICCESLVLKYEASDVARSVIKRFMCICEELGDYGSPRLNYQTDPRWKTADNRRKDR